jgi:Taurine catabolism dioxygenase TauD, TfdA family
MSHMSHRSAVGGESAWLASDLANNETWERDLDSSEITTITSALAHERSVNPDLDLSAMTIESFPLAGFVDEIARLRAQIVDGLGTMVYRGFPVERYSDHELRAVWWGLNLHVGTAVSQSWRGDVIGDVRDIGTGIAGRAGRGYTSNTELNFHSDAADVTGLFFLRQGRTGGLSRLASSVAVHNEILRRRPDLLDVLYEPFTVSCQANEMPGDPPWYELPVFGRAGDDVACAFVKTNILWAAKNTGAPPLADTQVEAIEFLAAVASEPQFWVERRFEAGTMWFCSNHTVLHMRTEFTDFDDAARKRHLLRVWMSLPNGRELPAEFASFFRDVRAGAIRGGYPSRSGDRTFSTA